MAQNIHLVTTIVAIMAIFENIYGSFQSIIVAIMAILKQRIQLTPDHTIVAIVETNKYESRWQQFVAIMAILKNPGDINCRNYGNFEDKKIYGSLFITIVAIMAILKTKNIRIPFHHNCCNYGNSEKIQLTPEDSNCGNCGRNKDESR